MIKQKTILEINKEERIYQFMCSPDSPLGEVYDCLDKMKAHVLDLMNAHKKNEEGSPKEA